MIDRRKFLTGTILSASVLASSGPAMAAKAQIYTKFLSSSAIEGYDTVAYFTEGKPVKGDKKFALKWKEAWWYFATQENLDKFTANPESYAPQFGGYCAYGVSQNAAVRGDPLLWKIVDGKLYLNINKEVVKIWNQDVPGYISSAKQKWPTVLQ